MTMTDRIPVAIRIPFPPERGGQDGQIRAAREMLAVAARMPGFIFHEPVDQSGEIVGYDLYWTGIEAAETWRARLYQAGLRKYSPAAWETFENMKLLEGRTLRPADISSLGHNGEGSGLWSALGFSRHPRLNAS